MGKYLLKRLGQMVIVVFVVTLLTFFLVDMVPGDIVYNAAGRDDLTQEEYDQIYYELNLDKSTASRYVIWLKNLLSGNLGYSYVYRRPVWDMLKEKIPTTLYLSFLAMLISVPLGVLFGSISAIRRKKPSDTIITLIANICNCLPQFWIGIMLMLFFSFRHNWLPSVGFGWPARVGWERHIKTIIMPVICVALGGIAGFTRQSRSAMLEVIRQDYIRTARSKGLSNSAVNLKHMVRNGLIPIVTILGSRLARILSGSMIVENVFSIPGMGLMAMTSINNKDIPAIQAIVLISTIVACLAFILTDVLYVLVDPRISLDGSAD